MAAYTGSFTAVGNSPAPYFAPLGMFNFVLTGTFVATVILEKSFDLGATWVPLSVDNVGTPNAYTAPLAILVNEPESVPVYRLRCSAWTSGQVNYRLSA